MLRACKKTQLRTRLSQNADSLEAIACTLYNNPDLRLQHSGQQDTILATIGPDAAEQVMVVLATGSGKTLIAIATATLKGAGTTVIMLPAVALRGNMLEQLDKIGLKTIL